MSLRMKVFCVLGMALALTMIGIIGLTRVIVINDYRQLENQHAVTNITRAWEALEDEVNRLAMVAGDWAQWDDTRDFVLGQKPEYPTSNLTDSALVTIQANLLMFWNAEGTLVTAKGVNLKDKKEWPVSIAVHQAISGESRLFHFQQPMDSMTGVLQTEEGPILIASCPITSSAIELPIHGTLIVGRFLDEILLSKLARQTQLDLGILDRTTTKENDPEIPRDLGESRPVAFVTPDLKRVFGYHLICDLAGRNQLVLQVRMHRDIMRQGMASVQFFLVSLGWFGFAAGILLWFLLHRLVLCPAQQLANHVSILRKTQDLTTRLTVSSNDEMGTLAREFNELTRQLHQARKQLNDRAFLSGMSEMAAGVLHNLRNALTPITTVIEELYREVDAVPIHSLRMAIEELAAHDTDSDRHTKLTRFVNSGRDGLIHLIERIHGRLSDIHRSIAQIEEILADQQQYCSNPSLMESIRPLELIQDSLTLVGIDSLRPAEVILDPSLEGIGPVPVVRVQMVQVISNLLVNAAESIRHSGRHDGHILLDAGIETQGSLPQLHIRVRDNGNGIAPEIFQRLFERGFSTKGQSNWGLGLHWCATILATLHGRIYAESEGLGKGATFHIEWPLEIFESGRIQ